MVVTLQCLPILINKNIFLDVDSYKELEKIGLLLSAIDDYLSKNKPL